MKTVLYCIILVLVMMAPVTKQDIGDLEPIQAVWIYIENNQIALKTDTGDYGTGPTVADAVRSMKQSSEGVVYLDTARYLLVSEKTVEHIETMVSHLKPTVKICLWEGSSVAAAAKYMKSHDIGHRIKELNGGTQLQEIPKLAEESRYIR